MHKLYISSNYYHDSFEYFRKSQESSYLFTIRLLSDCKKSEQVLIQILCSLHVIGLLLGRIQLIITGQWPMKCTAPKTLCLVIQLGHMELQSLKACRYREDMAKKSTKLTYSTTLYNRVQSEKHSEIVKRLC